MIPPLTSRSAVFDFFRAWGYRVRATEWDTAGLPETVRRTVGSMHIVADHSDGNSAFQIFLIELPPPPDGLRSRRARRADLRPLAEHFIRNFPQGDYLFIFALADYSSLTFVSPRRTAASRESLQLSLLPSLPVGDPLTGAGGQKVKAKSPLRLRILTVDPRDLTRTDRDILNAIRLGPDDGSPAAVLERHQAAFSVEKVTRDFYNEYRRAFESLKAELSAVRNSGQRHAVAQRMMSRLLFLCFLQKKRWLDQKSDYLFQLSDRAGSEGRNFYDDFLHPLFFYGLSHYEKDKPPDLKERIGLVPFLNGGLFEMIEPWDEAGRLRLDNRVFEPLLGPDGLLRRYNFTVAESTPDYQEVAVDPEMLGKVFESIVLQSESAEDYNAPDLRKATGSYYTPRIVVQFICRELLKNYVADSLTPSGVVPTGEGGGARLTALLTLDAADGLDDSEIARLNDLLSPADADRINKALDSLRACDPAVGSGAFALGLLQELVNLRALCDTRAGGKDPRDAHGPDYLFKKKLEFIEKTIYGVDLQAQAVEICKLRLWLSLVVDHELAVDPKTCTRPAFRQAIGEVAPLPNLSFKIRQGDALLEQIHGQPFRLESLPSSGVVTRFMHELQEAQSKFFSEQIPEKKRNLRRRALEARLNFTRHVLEHLQGFYAVQPMLLGEETKEHAAKRHWREAQIERIEAAQKEIAALERTLRPLFTKTKLFPADEELLDEVEVGDEKHLTFAWQVAFPEIFSPSPPRSPSPVSQKRGGETGFDLILGNPPFVTARSPEKRELYRERWKETAYLKFQLVAPFFQRGFSLLRPGGQLGFIVSNAFAKREFGRPLVEGFFPLVELDKVVDCSGLMFPGHGTPTCIVFGRQPAAAREMRGAKTTDKGRQTTERKIRVAAILPGGGDLRTAPEDSPLWHTLSQQHDTPGYADDCVIVADRPASQMAKWPWNFDSNTEVTRQLFDRHPRKLEELIEGDVGVCTMTNADDIFVIPDAQARLLGLPTQLLRVFQEGEDVRDWTLASDTKILVPYNQQAQIMEERTLGQAALQYLKPYKDYLANRLSFGNQTFDELGREWYAFERMNANKYKTPQFITFGEIATHAHFIYWAEPRVFERDSPVIKLPPVATPDDHHALTGLLNSSAALFWLKLVCFNKNVGEEEERDRYVYAGGKVQQLPIPSAVLESGAPRERLTALSRACWQRGQLLPALAFKKLFELEGEAYFEWNSQLSGWIFPSPLPSPTGKGKRGVKAIWNTAEELIAARAAYAAERARLRAQMIALQEEMDWLAYQAYGLLTMNYETMENEQAAEPLALGERPFELLRDGKPIPEHFSPERRALWQARMGVIQNDAHVRRIEQPVYKRRWYRKVSDDKEFQAAFEWWLLEKAEWWLEHKANGRPVSIEQWAAALWEDERNRAAATVVSGESGMSVAAFTKLLKSVVVESSVPDGLPAAVPWDELEKQGARVPARAEKIRGKLNVPRERFRERGKGEYVWAGKK